VVFEDKKYKIKNPGIENGGFLNDMNTKLIGITQVIIT